MRKSGRGTISPKGSQNSLVVGQSKSSPFRTNVHSALCVTTAALSLMVMLLSFNSSAWEIVTYDSENVLNGAEINPKYEVKHYMESFRHIIFCKWYNSIKQ